MTTETLERIDITITNKAGGPSYVAGDDSLVVRYMTTGMVGDTHYSSKETIARELVNICTRVAWHDPEFLAKAIVYARREGLMRTAPLIALAVLSTVPNKKPFYAIFTSVVQTPGDLQDFIALTRTGLKMDQEDDDSVTARTTAPRKIRLRGMGRAVRTACNTWMAKASSYHVIKYGADGQDMPLKDVLKLTHGKFTGTAQAQAAWLIKGAQEAGLPSQIAIYDDFKKLAGTPEHFEDALEAITKGRLPWEKVTGPFGKLSAEKNTRLWSVMARQMPYMALLRNLNNLLKYGVLNDRESAEYVYKTLTDPERVRTSKQFPYAFYSAYKHIQGDSEQAKMLRHALAVALDYSVANVPYLGENVLVACDRSGSMDSPLTRNKSGKTVTQPMRYVDVAHLTGAALFKQGDAHTDLVDFNQSLYEKTSKLNRSMSIIQMLDVLDECGGATSLWLPFQYALQKTDRTYDTIVAITDNESWAYETTKHSYGTRTASLIHEYQALRNPNLKVFLVTLAPTYAQMTPTDMPNVFYPTGWSAATLDYMSYIVKGNGADLDIVRDIVI